jgi:hypothetical protein
MLVLCGLGIHLSWCLSVPDCYLEISNFCLTKTIIEAHIKCTNNATSYPSHSNSFSPHLSFQANYPTTPLQTNKQSTTTKCHLQPSLSMVAPSPSTFLQDSPTRGQYPCANTPAYHQSFSFIPIHLLVPNPFLSPYLNIFNFSLLNPFRVFFSHSSYFSHLSSFSSSQPSSLLQAPN